MAGLPPRPTELVYVSRPSWMPALTALGLALLIVGLFSWWPYSVIGGIVALLAIIAWIRHATRDTSTLPVDQRPATAVLPAVPLRRRQRD